MELTCDLTWVTIPNPLDEPFPCLCPLFQPGFRVSLSTKAAPPEFVSKVLSGLQDFVERPGGKRHSCLVPHPQGKHSFVTSVTRYSH